jgi:hypothetical protein
MSQGHFLVPARNLIVPSRLDICSKIPLVRAWASHQDESWGRELYFSYLSKIEPLGGFSEDQKKFSLSDYYDEFKKLFDSMQNIGFEKSFGSIPVGSLGITNGAHRIAIGTILNLDVNINQTKDSDHIYDFNFMKQIGLEDIFIDSMLTEYLKIKNNVRAFCLMGLKQGTTQKVIDELSQNRNVIYYKTLTLSEIGQRRLMKVLYGGNLWWEKDLIETLSFERFNNDLNQFTCIFLESTGLENDAQLKNLIRSKYFVGELHKKIHSTDTDAELKLLSEVVLNSNSIHFLNHSPLGSEEGILARANDFLEEHRLNKSDFAIDGSGVFEIYGLRSAKDLDVVVPTRYWENSGPNFAHNDEYLVQTIKPNSIIYDPRCYLNINGFKFISLPAILAFKAFRGEPKDLNDIQMVVNQINNLPTHISVSSEKQARKYRNMLILRSFVERILLKMPNLINFIIKNLYKGVRKIYRKTKYMLSK